MSSASLRIAALALAALIAQIAHAQPSSSSTRSGATVSGVVSDSISRSPLAGAVVQLISDKDPSFLRTAISDSIGRFTILGVPVGHYKLGFIHPILDSLGVEAPVREVFVDSEQAVTADAALPSPARMRTAICGKPQTADSGAVIIGSVRDGATGTPIKGATVRGEWIEMLINRGGFARRLANRTVTTADNGWFALCNVPTIGSVALLAKNGSDSTGEIEVQIPPEGFARRELFLGNTGDGRLSGTVVSVLGNQPVPGAVVSVVNGPETHTDASGNWTLVNAPVGTRMLEIRALGYYPDRRNVNVVPNAPPVRVSLSILKAVLDTVKIMARRLPNGPDDGGFLQRRRMGLGKYITEADMIRFPVQNTSEVFRRIPGMHMELDSTGQTVLKMRGAFEDSCIPQIFIDGRNMGLFGEGTANDIDDWVRPNEVKGIEVYSEGTAPAQFQMGLNGCGTIVIWTK